MGKKVCVYDLRNSYKPVVEHFMKGGSQNLTYSDGGILGASYANGEIKTYLDTHIQPVRQPYISFKASDQVQDIDFCPMEDVLGIGYNTGFESIIIPGAGKSSIDSYENNPFRTKKQLDNWEVSRLLDKIPAKMITLDSAELRRVESVKKLDADQDKGDFKEEELDEELIDDIKEEVDESSESEEEERIQLEPVKLKNKMKGKGRTGHKELRKKQIRLEKVREHKNQLIENKMRKGKKIKKLVVEGDVVKKRSSALDRFR